MSALPISVFVTLFTALQADDPQTSPIPALSSLDWDLELNGTLPLEWDRSRWVLSVTKQGRFVLEDRAEALRAILDGRGFDPAREVEFLFYSRANGGKPVKLTFEEVGRLPGYGFRGELPTKILIHGYLSNSESEVVGPLAKEYIKKGDVNVIGVNWVRGAFGSYSKARNRVPRLADLIVAVIRKLFGFGQTADQIGLIGHSLGANVAGLVGKRIRPKVAYIVGLSPARVFFTLSEPRDRLADTDALHVEVIHTDVGIGSELRYGFFEPIGVADFYPNGGQGQPGCISDFGGICAHGRGVTYFKESLMARGYFASRCADVDSLGSKCSLGTVEFGEVHVHPLMSKPRGVYYFETNSEAPFLKTMKTSLRHSGDVQPAPNSLTVSVQSQSTYRVRVEGG